MTVAERTGKCAIKVMKGYKTARRGTYCMRAAVRYVRWMEERLEKWTRRLETRECMWGNLPGP